jgi:hypothetical protein
MKTIFTIGNVTVTSRNQCGEFEVRHGTPRSTYYTDDREDAIATARYIHAQQLEQADAAKNEEEDLPPGIGLTPAQVARRAVYANPQHERARPEYDDELRGGPQ